VFLLLSIVSTDNLEKRGGYPVTRTCLRGGFKGCSHLILLCNRRAATMRLLGGSNQVVTGSDEESTIPAQKDFDRLLEVRAM
jgi:hypothetical protein